MTSLFNSFQKGLERNRSKLMRNIQSLFSARRQWDQSTYASLEEAFLSTDIGIEISTRIISRIRDRYEGGLIHRADDIIEVAREDIIKRLGETEPSIQFATKGVTVVLLVGVNGSGKTTTAAKLAQYWKKRGKTVVLAACDTFRAGAIEQLKIWGERLHCPVIATQPGVDAAAVAYDAVRSAQARKKDILIIDTAGRQHTRKGLMDELRKLERSLGKACPGAPHETWLLIDASIGSNALVQAREFNKALKLSGFCLSKLDGSSKGGAVVAISEALKLPIYFIGLGEGVDALQAFDKTLFVNAFFTSI